VAENIEIQIRYASELHNVNVRQDRRYLAEKDLLPCGDRDESRFSPDSKVPLCIQGMEVAGDSNFPRDISCVQVLNELKHRFEGPEKARPSRPHDRPTLSKSIKPCSTSTDSSCTRIRSPTSMPWYPIFSLPSIGILRSRTQVPFVDAPVTIESN
jgi:hypothetical protein